MPLRCPRLAAGGIALALALAASPLGAADDCSRLYRVYQACHEIGRKAAPGAGCSATSGEFLDYLDREGEDLLAATGPEVVEAACEQGCEDAAQGRSPLSLDEFREEVCK